LDQRIVLGSVVPEKQNLGTNHHLANWKLPYAWSAE